MEAASGKYRIGFLATLLSVMLVTGCVAQMPVNFRAEGAGNGQDSGQERQAESAGTGRPQSGKLPVLPADAGENIKRPLSLPARETPLPRQVYDARGLKTPYVPQPNPYTDSSDPVPAEARAMYAAASARLSEGNLSSARAKFEQLVEKYPDLSGPWVRLGEIAERNDEYDEAIRHYRRAISLNANNVNAYIALGLAQRKQGRFNEAQNTYLAALDVWKDFPEAHLNLAILYDLYGNQAEAAQKHYEAYDFLTGGKDERARKWLVEVRRRTGIEQSFIGIKPSVAVAEPAGEGDNTSMTAAQDNP